MSIFLSNFARTVTTQGIDENATSVSVSDLGNFPASDWVDGGYSYVVLQGSANRNDVEVIKVTAAAGNTVTFERGQEGTTPRAFPSGSLFELRLTGQSLYDFVRQSCNNDSMQLSRAHNMDQFPANGFVDYGKHQTGGARERINEGLFTNPSSDANFMWAGSGESASNEGASKTLFPVTCIAGFTTIFHGMSSTFSNNIKLPSQPVDGSIIADSSGDARGTGQYNLDLLNEVDPKYGNTALAAGDSAQARAFEGDLRNGDFRDGANHWSPWSNDATLTVNNGIAQVDGGSNWNGFNASVSSIRTGDVQVEFTLHHSADPVFIEWGGSVGSVQVHNGGISDSTDQPVRVVWRGNTSAGIGQFTISQHVAGRRLAVSSVVVRQQIEEVVTAPVDMYGAEHWLEAITPEKPQCYPYGLPQQLGVDVDGIPTRAGTRPATYCSWFDGDLDSVGNEWDFFSLSVLEQDAILNNPDHNTFYSKGQYVQWRARGRSFRGAGNGDWANVDPLNSNALASVNRDVIAVTPQGMLDTPTDNTSWGSYFAGYGSANNPDNRLGVFTANSTTTSVTHTYFHVWGQVSRLNAGGYHPSFNSLGTRTFIKSGLGSDEFWYQDAAEDIHSKADCFDITNGVPTTSKVWAASGAIGQTSGRPDGLFHDAIYPSGQGGVLDDRLSARDMSSFEEAMKVDLKVKNGSYRGKQKIPFTKIFKGNAGGDAAAKGWGLYYNDVLPSEGRFSVYSSSDNTQIVSGNVGDFVSVVDASDRVLHGIVYSKPSVRQYNCFVLSVDAGFPQTYANGDFTGWHFVSPQDSGISVEGNIDNGFLVDDVSGPPAEILATPALANGWQGHWVPVTNINESPAPLQRKCINTALVDRVYTQNNGASWVEASHNMNSTLNQIDNVGINGYVQIYTYRAMPYVVEGGTNDAVFNGESGVLDSVFGGVWNNVEHGAALSEALLHKVVTNDSTAAGVIGTFRLTQTGFNHQRGELIDTTTWGEAGRPKHEPVSFGAPTNDSPAVKALVYQTSKTQRLGLNYAFNELKWETLSATDISGSSTAQKSAGITYRVTDGRFQGSYMTCTQGTTAAFDNAVWQLLPDGRVISSATGVMNFRLWQSGWNDDGTIQIGDGVGTYNNLAGALCLYGTKSLTKPYGYSGNYARAGEQVVGVDL